MIFDIITLFPEYFSSVLATSLLGKAVDKKLLQIKLHHLRDYAVNDYGKVDDAPYGGGHGMVLMVEPIAKALEKIRNSQDSHVILLSPRGDLLTQSKVKQLAKIGKQKSITLVCGHYEGFDERVTDFVDESLRIGDYVLSGGEPAAAILVDSIARLLPGFMQNKNSIQEESFKTKDYIEYPHYTRPTDYLGKKVPSVLLSGNHQEISRWREKQSSTSQEFHSPSSPKK